MGHHRGKQDDEESSRPRPSRTIERMGKRSSLLETIERLEKKRAALCNRAARELEVRAKAASHRFCELSAYATIPREPDALLHYVGLPEVQALCLPEPKRRLHLAEHFKLADRKTVYASGSGVGLLCWRTPAGLLIEDQAGQVKSWARAKSITGIGNGLIAKHLSRNADASYFKGTIPPVDLELQAFAQGIGHLHGSRTLFMYARFAYPVGEVVKPDVGKAGSSEFIKVQFDRVNRPKYVAKNGALRKQGFFLKSHGYPVNMDQLKKDFPSGASAITMLRLG